MVATTETPFCLFSAAKAVTAMVIHKLDEKGVLHLEDRVSEFIPEFGRHGKERITIRHVLAHRAGIPNLPPEALDLEMLTEPGRIVDILCDSEPRSRPGRFLAYHAVTGGFVLAEVVRRVTGQDIRTVLAKEVCEPLGFRWMNYGVAPSDVPLVAVNAMTGPSPPWPMKWQRELSNNCRREFARQGGVRQSNWSKSRHPKARQRRQAGRADRRAQ